MKKILPWLLVVILILVIVTIYYNQTATEDTTTTEITFNVPDNIKDTWTVSSVTDERIDVTLPWTLDPNKVVFTIRLYLFNKDAKMSVTDWVMQSDHELFADKTASYVCEELISRSLDDGKSLYRCLDFAAEYILVSADHTQMVYLPLGQDPALSPEQIISLIEFK